MPIQSSHGGIILAAGASERMGSPKALLQMDDGRSLARCQAELLLEAGCERVVTVLGADADTIRAELLEVANTINRTWELGRFSSVQTGLKAIQDVDGYLVLPIDTVGVQSSTIRDILEFAERESPPAVRPVFEDKEGHLAWISNEFAAEIMDRDPGRGDVRLDDLLRPMAIHLAVQDRAILTNVNTPKEWEACLRQQGTLKIEH